MRAELTSHFQSPLCRRLICVLDHRPGMTRYIEWQNSLRSTAQLFEARFLEIPSLMQTGLFQRSAVLAATAVRYLLWGSSTLSFCAAVALVQDILYDVVAIVMHGVRSIGPRWTIP